MSRLTCWIPVLRPFLKGIDNEKLIVICYDHRLYDNCLRGANSEKLVAAITHDGIYDF